jgi:hypothetical protein
MTTGTFVSLLTGLSPAALSALWAALRPYPSANFLRPQIPYSAFPWHPISHPYAPVPNPLHTVTHARTRLRNHSAPPSATSAASARDHILSRFHALSRDFTANPTQSDQNFDKISGTYSRQFASFAGKSPRPPVQIQIHARAIRPYPGAKCKKSGSTSIAAALFHCCGTPRNHILSFDSSPYVLRRRLLS